MVPGVTVFNQQQQSSVVDNSFFLSYFFFHFKESQKCKGYGENILLIKNIKSSYCCYVDLDLQ